jgi:hypothetical protein
MEYVQGLEWEEWDCQNCGYTIRFHRQLRFTRKGEQVQPKLHSNQVNDQ